jgi:hypothetical protein
MKLAVLISGLLAMSLPVTESTHCANTAVSFPEDNNVNRRFGGNTAYIFKVKLCFVSASHAGFLLSFFLDPEDGGLFSILADMFSIHSTEIKAMRKFSAVIF